MQMPELIRQQAFGISAGIAIVIGDDPAVGLTGRRSGEATGNRAGTTDQCQGIRIERHDLWLGLHRSTWNSRQREATGLCGEGLVERPGYGWVEADGAP